MSYLPLCEITSAQMELEFLDKKVVENISTINNFFFEKYKTNTDENVKDFLLKIDSIHDFESDRVKELDFNLYELFEWDEDDYSKIKKMNQLETIVFFWLIQKIFPKDDRMNYVDFRPSIQNYLIYEDVKKSNFTIDAALKEYNIFKEANLSVRILISAKERDKKLNNFLKSITDTYNWTTSEFSKVDNNKDDKFKLFCFAKNLSYCYSNFIKKLDEVDDNWENVKNWDKLYDFYSENETDIRNYNLKIKYYFQNKKIDVINNPTKNKYLNILNSYINFVNKSKIKKIPESYKPPAKLDIASLELTTVGYENIRNYLYLDEDEDFKVIAPQKFDPNRTTAGSGVDPTKILNLPNCSGDKTYLNKNKEDHCSFKLLEDTCYFYTEIDKGKYNFIFEIKDRISKTSETKKRRRSSKEDVYWPIAKVKITTNDQLEDVSYDENKSDDSIGIQTSKTIKQKDVGFFIGLVKQGNKYRFRYYPNQRTLVCTMSPGVSELVKIYSIFTSSDNKYYKFGLDSNIVLENILQIKRAGDYSQIWFCKKWNQKEDKKLFFMSNDRISASFCLLEKVPYIGQVSNYNFYFNPEGDKLSPTSFSTSVLKSIGINFEIPYLMIKHNLDIIENHDKLCEDFSYNKEPFKNYIRFINKFKLSKIDEKLLRLLSSLQTNILKYQEPIIDPKKCSLPDIIVEINKIIEELNKLPVNTGSNDNIIYNLYEEIKNIYDSDLFYKKCLIDDIKTYLKLDYESSLYTFHRQESMLIDYDDKNEKEANLFLKDKNIKKVVTPANADILRNIRMFENKNNIMCGNLLSQINYLTSDYNLKQENFLNTSSDDISNFSWDKNNIYSNNYTRLFNCLSPVYDNGNEKTKEIIKDILPDESFDTEMLGFSFENGLTYYHINRNTPSVISTKPYKHSNKTYIVDKNGLLTVSGNTKEGTIRLNNRQTKTLSYTDGTEISYYKF